MGSILVVPTQVKKYEGVFIKFMNYFHSAEYELGDSFSRDELLEIKPENIYNFMCLTAFGNTDVDRDDNPTKCRKDTLVYHKNPCRTLCLTRT